MPMDIGSLSVFMGPSQLAVGPGQQAAPDNLEAAIVDFIGRARETLEVAVQELESEPIARALIEAVARDVDVRVVLEEDYLHVRGQAVADAWVSSGRNEANRIVHAALLRGGVHVRSDFNGAIFHQKFIVRDLEGSRAGVLTGSTNFTPTGTNSNLNHLVTISGKRVAREYAREFDEIWDGTFGVARLRHDPSPGTATVSGVPVKVLFAPDHAPEMEIMKQMAKARQRVDFAIFTFSRSSGIDDIMLMLSRSGIALQGAFDRMQGNQSWSASRILVQAAGAAVPPRIFIADRGEGLNKLHHKLMVIDDRLVIGGSFNYTEPANRLNDENIIILGDLEETDPARIALHRQVGTYARAEIDRIIAVYGTQVQPPA